jgi:hypothetical protein
MYTRLTICACLITSLILTGISCRKHDQPNVPDIPVVAVKIFASFSGIITNSAGHGVEGAKVYIGNTVSTTGADGSFSISNVLVIKKRAFIKVEKEGYFQGSRTIIAQENNGNKIKITLLKKHLISSFSGSASATAFLPHNNGEIIFQANSIVTAANNQPYTGLVYVNAVYLDPAHQDFNSIMPGDLRGISNDSTEKMLKSYGMLAVEITGSNNEKLQLAPGKPATIKLPASIDAPQTIPLWYFNDSTGLWKEEGSATKSSGFYTGTVSHFSFWNCDLPLPFAYLRVTVLDPSGQPYPNATVTIYDSVIQQSTYSYTNNAGQAEGIVPANHLLMLTVQTFSCGIEYAGYIGPFSSSANPASVTVTTTPGTYSTTSSISGNVLDCNGNAVTNGYVYIQGAVPSQLQISNGNFSGSITYCGNLSGKIITAVDRNSNLSGSTTVISGSVPVTIIACSTPVPSFFSYSITGIGADSIINCTSVYANGTASAIAGSNQSNISLILNINPQSNPFGVFYLFSGHSIQSLKITRGNNIYTLQGTPLIPYPTVSQSQISGGVLYHSGGGPQVGYPAQAGFVMDQNGQTFPITFRYHTIVL